MVRDAREMKRQQWIFAAALCCLAGTTKQQEQIANQTTTLKITTTTTREPKTETPRDLPKPQDGKQALVDWLVHDTEDEHPVEYEGYDGWYNNPSNPALGSVDSQLVRLLPPAYADGVYEPSGQHRPNPFTISEKLMNGPSGQISNTGKTAFLVFFGQQVVEELLDVQRPGCPPEYFNIPVPKGHEFRKNPKHTEMPFLRSRYDFTTGQSPNNPRQQINEITPWFDGGLMYGTSKGWADTLREFKGGRLASSHGGKYPAFNSIRLPMANPPPPRDHVLKPVSRFFRLGNPRGNENPYLLTFGVFWFRWHNIISDALKRMHPDWTDEHIFNEARKWVIATHQHIVINTWLPEWLGESLDRYKKYDASIDPGIAHEFQTTAMRFGHTLVTSGGYRRSGVRNGSGCQVYNTTKSTGFAGHRAVRTCNTYWNPQEAVLEHDIDAIILGLSSQAAEREDNIIVEDLRGRVFGPLEFSRRDLMAINIQRSRDHGLPDYKTARRLLGLTTFNSFSEMAQICKNVYNLSPEIFERILPELYSNRTDHIDMWAGGILETELNRPGEMFRTVIKDQMRRIRDGDRFWFENKHNGLFTEKQVDRIKLLTIYDLILAVTSIEPGDIQRNPFKLPSESNSGMNAECREQLNMRTGNCTVDVTSGRTETCFYLPPLATEPQIANCTTPLTFDYFSGSEASYALSFLAVGVFIVGCIALLIWLANRRSHMMREARKPKLEEKRKTIDENAICATEWMGKREGRRDILVRFREDPKMITVHLLDGQTVRSIDLKHVQTLELQVSASGKRDHVSIRVAREYDLVLSFSESMERENFIRHLEDYLGSVGVGRQRREISLPHMFSQAITKRDRQQQLEMFFRVVFAQAFHIDHDKDELLRLDAAQARNIINTELTIYEFADALSVRPDSTFMQQMFALVDTDNNGYVSFREFLDMIILFAKGTPEDKAKLVFDMYDFDHSGKLTHEQFTVMIKSMLELSNHSLSVEKLNQLVTSMFKAAGLSGKEDLAFSDFSRLVSDYRDQLGYIQLQFDVAGFQPLVSSQPLASAAQRATNTVVRAYSYFGGDEKTPLQRKRTQVRVETTHGTYSHGRYSQMTVQLVRFLENYRLHIFWIFLYTFLLFGIFVERAYFYSVEREHGGLRRIAGYGVTITRGAASVIMFTYSTILLTSCRNLLTFLRETFLRKYIPFDAAVFFHKYVAVWGLIFSLIHTVGHAFNFYHIATQTANDLSCLFRDYYHATDELPKFHYWCFQTITGLTGVLLVLLGAVIYIFSFKYARQHLFKVFWVTHNLYPAFYALMILHGLGLIVQPPFFYYFVLGPCIVFVLDRLVSVSRKKVEISVIRSEMLPSGVTMLLLKRPPNFEYKSGQWVRIACPILNGNEYHPFTLSSAPHEETISLHIRAIGPWTHNLRKIFDPGNLRQHAYPKIFLDGPFGDSHEDWFRYEVAVLIGGGIGVTPFSSILKDLAYRANLGAKVPCKKVYFLWITRTQRHFEWVTDIIRDVEDKDRKGIVAVHIFITQFYQKFDLRTTMLYICERHFQKISDRSLFTGLRSVTHFGRPNFKIFLDSLQREHPSVSKFGIFSCGPPPMTINVQNACDHLNKREGAIFVHNYENF